MADIQHQFVKGIHIGRSRFADRISEVPFRKSGAIWVMAMGGRGRFGFGYWLVGAGCWLLVMVAGLWVLGAGS